MKKAIQETLDLHHAAEVAGMSYVDYKEEKDILCPLCQYYICSIGCKGCPWTIFEGLTCSDAEYNNYGASVLRLTNWLEKCE
jgi:hypothetical protein